VEVDRIRAVTRLAHVREQNLSVRLFGRYVIPHSGHVRLDRQAASRAFRSHSHEHVRVRPTRLGEILIGVPHWRQLIVGIVCYAIIAYGAGVVLAAGAPSGRLAPKHGPAAVP
jgi:hypothetical protein